jgi:hypothetical protein
MLRQMMAAGFVTALALLPAAAEAKSDDDHGRRHDQGGSHGRSDDRGGRHGRDDDRRPGWGHTGGDKGRGHGGGLPGGGIGGGGGHGAPPTVQVTEPIVLAILGAGLAGALVLRRRK